MAKEIIKSEAAHLISALLSNRYSGPNCGCMELQPRVFSLTSSGAGEQRLQNRLKGYRML